MANTFFGTRGLAFGGGPFEPGLANNIVDLFGWPPIVSVHISFVIASVGIKARAAATFVFVSAALM